MWSQYIPTFIWAYLGTAMVIFAGALAHRRRLFSGPPTLGIPDPHVDPQQAAYLGNGERPAVYASLAGLRCAGAVGLAADRTLTVTGPLPVGATALDRAVYDAAERGLPQQALRADPPVQEAVAELKEELEQAGLLLDPPSRRAARRGAWLLLALLAIGAARFGTGLGKDAPVGYLGVAVLAVLAGHLFLIIRIPRRTAAGDAALVRLHRSHRYLAPRQRPAFDTYGPPAAGMAVALFGTEALWTLDPAMAEEAAIEHGSLNTGPTGTVGADGASWGDSGGGGCGGGGCGGGGGG